LLKQGLHSVTTALWIQNARHEFGLLLMAYHYHRCKKISRQGDDWLGAYGERGLTCNCSACMHDHCLHVAGNSLQRVRAHMIALSRGTRQEYAEWIGVGSPEEWHS
jgi:hypothetical protein